MSVKSGYHLTIMFQLSHSAGFSQMTYLTSVRKEASSLRVIPEIRLNNPSQIRGMSPTSPYGTASHDSEPIFNNLQAVEGINQLPERFTKAYLKWQNQKGKTLVLLKELKQEELTGMPIMVCDFPDPVWP